MASMFCIKQSSCVYKTLKALNHLKFRPPRHRLHTLRNFTTYEQRGAGLFLTNTQGTYSKSDHILHNAQVTGCFIPKRTFLWWGSQPKEGEVVTGSDTGSSGTDTAIPLGVDDKSITPTATTDLSQTSGYIPEPPPVPATTTLPEGYIPDLPDIPAAPEAALNALGEPLLSSLGLCNYTPVGLVQAGLEALHVSANLPWCGAIVAGTIIIRLCMFPLVVASQRNTSNMQNHMPVIQRMQEQFTKARTSGDAIAAARKGHELMDYMTRNKVKPMKNMMMPMAQVPVFISVFVGLRQMANLPVESLTTGGILWFTDLTLADPYWALPLLTSVTFLATVELGVDTMKAESMAHTMKWVMRLMPIMMFPLISQFPTAMLCYWLTSNIFSLTQVLFLRIPRIRTFFNIPALVKHDQSMQAKKKKGFTKGFTETWSNSKLMAKMEERERIDSVRFREAGMGPITKTYPYDPTKQSKAATKEKQKIKQAQ